MTSDGSTAFSYDAESNMTASTYGATSSVYDAFNHRVQYNNTQVAFDPKGSECRCGRRPALLQHLSRRPPIGTGRWCRISTVQAQPSPTMTPLEQNGRRPATSPSSVSSMNGPAPIRRCPLGMDTVEDMAIADRTE